MSWSTPTSSGEAFRRAGGRRAYNALRRDLKLFRRLDVAQLLLKYGCQWGVQARIARELGVSEAVVSRDVKANLHNLEVCQECGSYRPHSTGN